MIGIASDEFNTFGGLTSTDNALLGGRAADIATHLNAGGGLLGFSNCRLATPYAYLGSIGAFTCGSVDYSDITPTPAGLAIGITDALDLCCWHDTYTSFPAALDVLATAPGGSAAAIGGVQVVIPGFVLTPGMATNPVGTSHTVTITVTETVGGVQSPVPGVTVNFTISGMHTASGACVTDANGQCSFTYTGTTVGTDTITATATVAGQAQEAIATKTWEQPLPPPEFACQRSQGFWKNHPTAWPVPSLTLGSVSYTQTQLLNILWTPVRGDASLILAKQLMAAKLNIANGSDPAPISITITNADGLLGGTPNPQNVKTPSPLGQGMVRDAGALEAYNDSATPNCLP